MGLHVIVGCPSAQLSATHLVRPHWFATDTQRVCLHRWCCPALRQAPSQMRCMRASHPSLPLSLQGGFLHGSPSPRLQPSSSTSRHLSAAGSERPNATDDTGSGSFGRSTVVHEGTAGRAGSLTPFQAALASGQRPLLSQQHARSPTAADAAALGSAAPLSEAAHRQHATSRSGTASSSMRPAPPASGGNQSSRPSSGRQPSRQVHQLLRAVHTL